MIVRRLGSCMASAAFLFCQFIPATSFASSHREAPFVTEHPKVDGTDFYMFDSYEGGRQDYVTLIANYSPLQDAYGGPNYFSMDPDALYEIHVDNNGDAKEDLTFQFRFKNKLKDIALNIGDKKVSVPLINVGKISASNNSALNVIETYSVNVIRGNRDTGRKAALTNALTNSTTFVKPVDNIGNKSIPDYDSYANRYIYMIKIPGCSGMGKMFVGQRKEGFAVNLGEVFDLINLNPVGATNSAQNIVADKNVTSLALELPKSCLVSGKNTTIGAWTTASLPKDATLRAVPNFYSPEQNHGGYVQVSRLGMPLVNELVIGIKDKDKFNASEPKNDAQFINYVTNPTLPALIEVLFGSAGVKAPTKFPRSDLVSVFLTGIDGLNKTKTASEMLRLNTAIPAVAAANQNTLGVLANDLAGFPNGRRPGDDVVDAALRVVMGVLLSDADAPSRSLPYNDGAAVSANDFDSSFPYLKTPLPGSPNKS